MEKPVEIIKTPNQLNKKKNNESDMILNIKSKENNQIKEIEEETPENKNFDSEIFSKDTSFKELGVCEEICEILTILNYKYPTKIQKETLPYTLKSHLNII